MLSTIFPYLTWVLEIPTSLKALGMTLLSIAECVNLDATVKVSLHAKIRSHLAADLLFYLGISPSSSASVNSKL